jgi:hypothetical protein
MISGVVAAGERSLQAGRRVAFRRGGERGAARIVVR